MEEIGDNFLMNGKEVLRVDISGFYNVKKIGKNFMSGCAGIELIDFKDLLKELVEFRDGFLSGCINLKSLDLSVARKLVKVGSGFLKGNKNINSDNIVLPENIKLGVEGKPSKNLIAILQILEQLKVVEAVDENEGSGVNDNNGESEEQPTKWKRFKKALKNNTVRVASGVAVAGAVHLITFLIILL